MANVNIVVISGNLTREPELRETASGSAILSFGMAVNDMRKNPQTGNWESVTNFVDVVTFGNRANGLDGILHKGMKVTVSGRLHWTQWETAGKKRSKLEVIAGQVELPPKQTAVKKDEDAGFDPDEYCDEDIPF